MTNDKSSWNHFLERVTNEINRLHYEQGCTIPFFRGQNDNTWKLIPSIFRVEAEEGRDIPSLQDALEVDFKSNYGIIYEKPLKSWKLYFEMRHANLPTRLLDWTENFAVALYFALNDPGSESNSDPEKKNQPCIWILHPCKLNNLSLLGDEGIPPAEDSLMPFPYDDLRLFDELEMKEKDRSRSDESKLKKLKELPMVVKGPFALFPPRAHKRIFAQKSVFTLHVVDTRPIEDIFPGCVTKFDIPLDALDKANEFLNLAGINEYSVFPDLDGLGRYLKKRHKILSKK
ncbi:MAG: hypothetical protein STSR0009_05240 [Methanoregula sp.]